MIRLSVKYDSNGKIKKILKYKELKFEKIGEICDIGIIYNTKSLSEQFQNVFINCSDEVVNLIFELEWEEDGIELLKIIKKLNKIIK